MDSSVLRQSEINEWYYHMKLESLFISQLCFIGLSYVLVLLSLSKAGLFRIDVISYNIVIIFILLFFVWTLRYYYTRNKRDIRYWNRMRFSNDNKKPATLSSEVVSLQAQVASCTK